MVSITAWCGVLGRELHSRKCVCVHWGGGLYHTIRFYDYPVRTNISHCRKKKGNKKFLATINLGKKKKILRGKTKLYYYDIIKY